MVIKTAKSAFEHYDRHFGKKNVPPEKKRQDKIVMALYFMGDEGRKSVLRQADLKRSIKWITARK